jgi:hypothetical protein
MWNFLFGYLFAGATVRSRVWRVILLIVFVGALIVGIVYASTVFHVLIERSQGSHVQPRS